MVGEAVTEADPSGTSSQTSSGLAAVADGDPTRWYDELWSAAARGEVAMPWDRTEPHRLLSAWLGRLTSAGGARSWSGCGLGADAEHLALRGWTTTAFDISPAAVAAARKRHPGSLVDYREGNLLDLFQTWSAPSTWSSNYTLQALDLVGAAGPLSTVPSAHRTRWSALVIQVVRTLTSRSTAEPPWS